VEPEVEAAMVGDLLDHEERYNIGAPCTLVDARVIAVGDDTVTLIIFDTRPQVGVGSRRWAVQTTSTHGYARYGGGVINVHQTTEGETS
jgi:hypothetical protein